MIKTIVNKGAYRKIWREWLWPLVGIFRDVNSKSPISLIDKKCM